MELRSFRQIHPWPNSLSEESDFVNGNRKIELDANTGVTPFTNFQQSKDFFFVKITFLVKVHLIS